jgi:hypothetical protein
MGGRWQEALARAYEVGRRGEAQPWSRCDKALPRQVKVALKQELPSREQFKLAGA